MKVAGNEVIRTIRCTFGDITDHKTRWNGKGQTELKKRIDNILIDGFWYSMFFYKDWDGSLKAEAASLAMKASYGKWYVAIPFRKEFKSEAEGNEFFKNLMANKKISKKGKEYYILPN